MKKFIILFFTILFLMITFSTSFATNDVLPNLEMFKGILTLVSTNGLSVVLVIYYVFFMHKKELDKYSDLDKRFGDLNSSYEQLINDLKPKERTMSIDQTKSVGDLGLDRDYYKLYKRMLELCKEWENDKTTDVEVGIKHYMSESISDTIRSWDFFITPIGNLKNHFSDPEGVILSKTLCDLIKSDKKTIEKIILFDSLLLSRVRKSKIILQEKLETGDRRKT